MKANERSFTVNTPLGNLCVHTSQPPGDDHAVPDIVVGFSENGREEVPVCTIEYDALANAIYTNLFSICERLPTFSERFENFNGSKPCAICAWECEEERDEA